MAIGAPLGNGSTKVTVKIFNVLNNRPKEVASFNAATVNGQLGLLRHHVEGTGCGRVRYCQICEHLEARLEFLTGAQREMVKSLTIPRWG
jgi:hypothetical protein